MKENSWKQPKAENITLSRTMNFIIDSPTAVSFGLEKEIDPRKKRLIAID